MYKDKKNQGGLCFGFAYTTAAICNGYPNVSIISTINRDKLPEIETKNCDNIRDILNVTVDFFDFTAHTTRLISSYMSIGSNVISIEDYIKYAHIYQFSKNVQTNSVWYESSASDILALVKKYTNDDKIGVTIGMIEKKEDGCGHQVLAIGYKNNTILVDDPNFTGKWQTITVNEDGTWEFSGLSGWNSDTCMIRYNLDITEPYRLLASGTTTKAQTKYDADDNEITETYIEGIRPLNGDCSLLSVSAETFSTETKLTAVKTDIADDGESQTEGKLYWTDENVNAITFDEVNGEDISVEMAGNDVIMSVSASDAENLKLDTVNQTLSCSVTDNTPCTIAFNTFGDEENDKETDIVIAVAGNAENGNIAASATVSGIEITGIENGTVTLTVDDEVISTQEISCADGEIEVEYDKTGEDTDIALQYEEKHSYESAVTAPTCGAQGYTTHTCTVCGDSFVDSYTEPTGEHTWNSGEVTIAPNCRDAGVKTFTCTGCGATKTETIARTTDHRDADGNGVCDICDADLGTAQSSCSCRCHQSGFMGFIWKIQVFFYKLFGKTDKQYCACGAKHW